MAQLSWSKFPKVWHRVKHTAINRLGRPTMVASLVVTALVIGGRQMNLLEPLELGAYDLLVRLRPSPEPDPRILVVGVTESDIQKYKEWPISDALLAQLLTKIESYEPRVIGLDIYRDIPIKQGYEQLVAQLKKSDQIVPVCKFPDQDNPGIPSPPSVSPKQAGFSDIVVDPGGIVRRGLLFLSPSETSRCKTPFSLSFQLAQRYLAKEGIKPIELKRDYFKLGKTVFKPLEENDGSYQRMDARGYQILLNYRSADAATPQVSMDQVLTGQLDESMVRDRIVLIGVTAASGNDTFYTPYSAGKRQSQKMAGVMVHAQVVSQIISAALNQRRLFWFWPDWGEALWVFGWSLVGGLLAWRLKHPMRLAIGEFAVLGILSGTSWILFTQAGWVPLVPPAMAVLGTGASVVAYTAYKAQQEKEAIVRQVQEQENTIELLRTLRNETIGSRTEPLPTGSEEEDEGTAICNLETVGTNGAGNISSQRPSSFLAGRYQIEKVLGKGGFGRTYLAKDTQRPGQPQCVVKHLRPARQDERFMQIARRLFATEAEILEKLGHHNQIPQLLAYFEEDKEFYLVEEFVKGHALSDELPTDKRLPETKVVEILQGILEVLVFMHEHQVIHRDLKPSNIIRREHDGRLVLIDFGAVKQMQPDEAEEKENLTIAIGTKGYTPPEQYRGRPRLASDIYALGMIVIEALSGIEPHHLPVDPETDTTKWRHLVSVGQEFAAIIEKMVCDDLTERYKSAAEVLIDVKRLAAEIRQLSAV